MINEYEKLNTMVKEDISWSEYAFCCEYANPSETGYVQ